MYLPASNDQVKKILHIILYVDIDWINNRIYNVCACAACMYIYIVYLINLAQLTEEQFCKLKYDYTFYMIIRRFADYYI